MINLTIDQIKELLPSVSVKHGKYLCTGTLKGRKLAFPVIYYYAEPNQPRDCPYVISVAWETVQSSLSSNTPINAGA